jgi:MFS family permease
MTKAAAAPAERSLRRRLLPFQIGVFLQGIIFWVPVEKLFMTEIGFTAATVGAMAAAYAVITPLLEVPSGILADRWSRRGVLVVGSIALAASSLIGGLSWNVASYVVSALILGVYFAFSSGTADAILYDTVLEETGDSESFERQLGHVRLVTSGAFVASSLAGGVMASLVGNRVTYLISVPVIALSLIPLLVFDEPRLNKVQEPSSLRRHLSLTVRAVIQRGQVLRIVVVAVLLSVVTQAVVEFGPLWLVSLDASPVWYGPYWAMLMSTFGLGGLIAGRLPLSNVAVAGSLAAVMVLAGVAMTLSVGLALVIAAQVALAVAVVVAGIAATRLLHDALPSAIRVGAASGVSTLTWLVFLPFSLAFGAVSQATSVQAAAVMLVAVCVTVGALLVLFAARPTTTRPAADEGLLSMKAQGHGMRCDVFVETVSAFLDGTLDPASHKRFVDHLLTCPGCETYLDQFRQVVGQLGHLPSRAVPREARALLAAAVEGQPATGIADRRSTE